MDEPNLIAEAKNLCHKLTNRLPSSFILTNDTWFISPAGNMIGNKLPSKAMSVIGSLAYRAKDLSELSCELFERKKIVPAVVLTRALMETTALLYLTQKKIAQSLETEDITELDEFLIKCMSGNRINPSEPDSINIMTAIQHLDREAGCERYADFYNTLCEFSHPNSLGTFSAYTKFNPEDYSLSFGENKGLTRANDVAFATVFALEIIIEFYDRAVAMIPRINELSKKIYRD
jgi:hypothetical protein